MNRILTFDLSKVSTGWAYFEDRELKDYGVIQLKYKTSDLAHTGDYLSRISSEFSYIVNKFEPTSIIVEDTFSKNIVVFKILVGIHAMLHKTAYTQGVGKVPLTFVNNTLVKKCFGVNISKKTFRDTYYCVLPSYSKTTHESTVYTYCTKMRTVNLINDKYDLDFKFEDNDITDAILLGLYYIKIEGKVPKKKRKKR